MANQANHSGNSGLKKRKSYMNADDNVDGNIPHIAAQPNQMGWMPYPAYPPQAAYPPNQYGMGWGMQPLYPPQMGIGYMPQQPYPYPTQPYQFNQLNQSNQYANANANANANGMQMGWMPQQPMMMLPPPHPGFNPRGFAPSHNGNIQDLVQINELEEEQYENPIAFASSVNSSAASAASAASAVSVSEATPIEKDEDEYEDEDNDIVYFPIPNSKNKKQSTKSQSNPQYMVPVAVKKSNQKQQVQKQDQQLANLFDKVLDGNMQDAVAHNQYAEFGQESDASNVITGLEPINKNQAHFDNSRFPNELYTAVMYCGNASKLSAKDISSETLETGKTVYYHNKQLAAQPNEKLNAGKAFIYVRSSRTNDISIETQRKACLQYAEAHNIELLSFGYQSDNNISARNMNNLNYELGFWKNQIPDNSNIIIYSIDRLSRNLVKGMQFLDEMATRGIRIHFTTHELVFHAGISAAGRAMVQQELQSAEKFSNIASEKVRTTMARLRQEGHVFGRAPYGYKNTRVNNIRKRVPNNSEMHNIWQIQSQYIYIMNNWKNIPDTADQGYTKINMLRALTRWCIRTGLKYRNHKNYTKSQLKTILQMDIKNVNVNN